MSQSVSLKEAWPRIYQDRATKFITMEAKVEHFWSHNWASRLINNALYKMNSTV